VIINQINKMEDKGDQLNAAIDSLILLSKKRCSEHLEKQVTQLRDKLATFTFNLVVLGEFKRGNPRS